MAKLNVLSYITGADEGRVSGWSAADLTRRRVPQPVVSNTSNVTSKQKTPLGGETSSKDVMVSVSFVAPVLTGISTNSSRISSFASQNVYSDTQNRHAVVR